MEDTQNTVDEAEVIEEAASADDMPTEKEQLTDEMNLGEQLIQVEKAIKLYVQSLKMKQGEIKQFSDSIRDALEGDAVYQEQTKKVNEVQQLQKKRREEIMNTTAVIQAKGEIKSLRADMAEMKDMLSKRLLEYNQLSGLNEIEIEGDLQSILKSAKLSKRKPGEM